MNRKKIYAKSEKIYKNYPDAERILWDPDDAENFKIEKLTEFCIFGAKGRFYKSFSDSDFAKKNIERGIEIGYPARDIGYGVV